MFKLPSKLRINSLLVRIILLLSLFCFTEQNYAFDGKRKGFQLGIGTGAGCQFRRVRIKTSEINKVSNTDTDFSVFTDLEIGYAPNNKTSLFLGNMLDMQMSTTTLMANCFTPLGLKYFFKNSAPSSFMNVGIGHSVWFYPFDSDWNRRYAGNGFGLFAGYGFEIIKRLSIKLDLLFCRPLNKTSFSGHTIIDDTFVSSDPELKQYYNIYTIRLILFYLAY